MSQKIFDNDLFVTRKSKVVLMFGKPAHVGMYISDLSKVLIYEFCYDCVKNKYANSRRLLFTDSYSLMDEIKTEYFYEEHLQSSKDCNHLFFGKLNLPQL